MSAYSFRPVCPKCGAELFPPDAMFCTQCGAKVSENASVYEIAFDDNETSEETVSLGAGSIINADDARPSADELPLTATEDVSSPSPAPPMSETDRKSQFPEDAYSGQSERISDSSQELQSGIGNESEENSGAADEQRASFIGMPQPYCTTAQQTHTGSVEHLYPVPGQQTNAGSGQQTYYIPVQQPYSYPGHKVKAEGDSSKRQSEKWVVPVILCAVAGVAIISAAALGVWKQVLSPSREYDRACSLMEEGEYDDAIELFEDLGDYKDCSDKTTEAKYQKACHTLEEKEYRTAEDLFMELGDYRDSEEKVSESKYRYGISLLDAGKYEEAISTLEEVEDYSDSADYLNEAKYQYCRANRYCSDTKTYDYLCYLRSISYKKSESLYHEIYDLRAEVAFLNAKKKDDKTLCQSVSKLCTFFHFGFYIYGGTPNEKLRFYYSVTYPDGSRSSGLNDPWVDSKNGELCSVTWENGVYSDLREYGETGNMYIDIINQKTGKRIIRMTVNITD